MSKRDVWEFTNYEEDVWLLADYLEAQANGVAFTFEDDEECDAFFLKAMREFQFFAERCCTIRTKDNKIERIRMNKAQKYLCAIAAWQIYHTGKVRIIIVKGRQQGLSTIVQARASWRVIHNEAYNCMIMAHLAASSTALFGMTKRYINDLPEDLRPAGGHDNGLLMTFPALDSQYKVATAGSPAAGRGETASFMHLSECAFFSDGAEIASGIMQTIPNAPGTEIFMESTANGAAGYFYNQWMMAAPAVNASLEDANSSAFIRCFIPWFWNDEYAEPAPDTFVYTDEEQKYSELYGTTRDQMYWRRMKILELDGDIKRMDRDYPPTAELAFQSSGDNQLITGDLVAAAMQWTKSGRLVPSGAVVMGVDVAAFGDDKTAIVIRSGAVVVYAQTLTHATNREIAARLAVLREQYGVDMIFIDGTGGYGTGVHDVLVERGQADNCMLIHFAESANEPNKFYNKRSEMWVNCRDWMRRPCSLPLGHDWGRELVGSTYRFVSASGLLLLEPKADIKKRIGKSPDLGDALALTFAHTVNPAALAGSYEPEFV